jgi:hypothetical protein
MAVTGILFLLSVAALAAIQAGKVRLSAKAAP